MSAFRVFVDTAAMRHSITRVSGPGGIRVLSAGRQTWAGESFDAVTFEPFSFDPTAHIKHPRTRAEIDLLALIAAAAREGRLELLWHGEAHMEFWRTQLAPGPVPELLAAGVTYVSGPIRYARPIGDRQDQVTFLKSIDHPHFLELQVACGAYQGKGVAENQLIDAFHVWCAEEGHATHFLTTDFRLIRTVHQCKKVKPRVPLVTPSELLSELNKAV